MLYNKILINSKGIHLSTKIIYILNIAILQNLKVINKINPYFLKYKNKINNYFIKLVKLIKEFYKVHRPGLEDNNLAN
jgi:hypothetical protein